MSRTYRRTTGDQSDHRYVVEKHTNPWRHGPVWKYSGKPRELEPDWERALAKELARYHSDNGWSMNTPSWWVRDFMTEPQRQEVRRLIHQVRRSACLEDAGEIMFPLAKKPHHYYW